MKTRNVLKRSGRALRRLLHLIARPVQKDRGRGGLLIQPYRGYGSSREMYMMGRVFRQPGLGQSVTKQTTRRDLLDIFRRFVRRGVRDAVVIARFGSDEQRVRTDRDGYFSIHMHFSQPLRSKHLWHSLDLELAGPEASANKAEGLFFVPPENARRVIISDIDDTVMYTGVVNKALMMWRLFVQGPRSRVAFPGVAAFYQSLHHGLAGDELNPMLYVSRGPWSIYEVLVEFFHLHRIPVGPILFLREWGLTLQRPLPRRAEDHKLTLIRRMLALYSDLPFVLIGDSGQHDPEIYLRVIHEHPGRVLATYIRNVSREPARAKAIEELAAEVIAAGSNLLLAADSFAMAEHAVDHGLIPPEALVHVLKERREQEDRTPLHATRKIEGSTQEQTQQALDAGKLEEALQEHQPDDAPPNIAVQSQSQAGHNRAT
ncbi:App1 family protein [Candidatus Laterigemmans baculatus]|uniref:App1 family protein n=1 Tax=Candidatus Laterigemmans baculatus TaxID=2770505 RepID=UPI0013DC5BE3|nr:phosphatase domain-containing protein [Candidatus Laterigemmans baculatus]